MAEEVEIRPPWVPFPTTGAGGGRVCMALDDLLSRLSLETYCLHRWIPSLAVHTAP